MVRIGLQDALNENSAVMHREAVCLPPASPESRYRFVRLSLKEVNLGYPGRQSARSQIHKAIAALSPGDPLHTRLSSQGRWQLLDKNGSTVGKLSKNFEPPQNMRCRSAKVLAIVEVEPRDIGSEVSRESEMRFLGGGSAGTGLRAAKRRFGQQKLVSVFEKREMRLECISDVVAPVWLRSHHQSMPSVPPECLRKSFLNKGDLYKIEF